MLRVPIEQAEEGMVLAVPIHHPAQPSRVLLTQGAALKSRSISRLRDLSIAELWIRYPGLEHLSRFVNPKVLQARRQLTNQLTRTFESIGADSGAPVAYNDFKCAIRDLIDKLLADPAAAVFLEEMAGCDRPLLHRSSAVSFISLLMGLRLGGYLRQQRQRLPPREATNVVNLGVGAMLHDIGSLHIDPEVVDRWRRSQDDDDPEWREHVRAGYELVRGKVDPTAASAVLHHHQRWDGAGYPDHPRPTGEARPLAGEEIHVFARIIAVAERFQRLRHPPDESPAVPKVRVLKRMLTEDHGARLDPTILLALLAVAPPYPPGSLVTLTSGERAVVVGWRPADPCRPSVQVVHDLIQPDADDDPVIHDLREATHLQVQEAEGEPVLGDNFYPERSAQFELTASQSYFGAVPRDLMSGATAA